MIGQCKPVWFFFACILYFGVQFIVSQINSDLLYIAEHNLKFGHSLCRAKVMKTE